MIFFVFKNCYIFFDGKSCCDKTFSLKSERVAATVCFCSESVLKQVAFEFVSSGIPVDDLKCLVGKWGNTSFEEGVLGCLPNVLDVSFTADGCQINVVFDKGFLSDDWSVMKKLKVIESFFKTINSFKGCVAKVLFLVDFEPMQDEVLDFSNPWVIRSFD